MEQSTLSSASENLMERIVDSENLERAWRNVKANRGAPGPDGITIDEFPEYFRPLWPEIRQQLWMEPTSQARPAESPSPNPMAASGTWAFPMFKTA